MPPPGGPRGPPRSTRCTAGNHDGRGSRRCQGNGSKSKVIAFGSLSSRKSLSRLGPPGGVSGRCVSLEVLPDEAYLAQVHQTALQQAEAPRLDQDVAQRGALDRARYHRQLGRIGSQLGQEAVPDSTSHHVNRVDDRTGEVLGLLDGDPVT